MDLDAIINAAQDKRSKKDKQRAQAREKKEKKAAKKVQKDKDRFDSIGEYDALDKVMDSVEKKRKIYAGKEGVKDIREEEVKDLVQNDMIKQEQVEDETWEETIDTETGKLADYDYDAEEEVQEVQESETVKEDISEESKWNEEALAEINSSKIAYINQIPRLCIRDLYMGVRTFSVMRDVGDLNLTEEAMTDDDIKEFMSMVIRFIVTSSTPFCVVPRSIILKELDDMKIKSFNKNKFIMVDIAYGVKNFDGIVYCFLASQDIFDDFNEAIDDFIHINQDINGEDSVGMAIFDLFYEIFKTYEDVSFADSMTDAEWVSVSKKLTDIHKYMGKLVGDRDTEFFLLDDEEVDFLPFVPENKTLNDINEFLGYTEEDTDGGVDHAQEPFPSNDRQYGRAVPTEGGGRLNDGTITETTEKNEQEEKEKVEETQTNNQLDRYNHDGAGIPSRSIEEGDSEIDDDDIEKALRGEE